MNSSIPRSAEHVSNGHPDKFCDQVADKILDTVYSLTGTEQERRSVRTAIECLAKDNLLIVSGEVKLPRSILAELDVIELARETWVDVGYGLNPDELTVINHIRSQSPDIAIGGGTGTDAGGAGDQGVMVGYATNETPTMMPREWALAQAICMELRELRLSRRLPWLKSDCKTQVTLDSNGQPISVIIAAQHADSVSDQEITEELLDKAVFPIIGTIDRKRVKINGTGRFTIGGPTGDAGVVGRKIVVDAYGPRVPVGGGAYSGKDPSKVDRSAAYMARSLAKSIVREGVGGANECTVTLAYGIGQLQPEMVTAITETGRDVSSWVKERYKDLSPGYIIDFLGLRNPSGWSYYEAAAFGHYGREMFPWEQVR